MLNSDCAMENFDLIVIGAGPGGYEAAAGAAALGRRVAVIERDELGGTCLNRGCIPTKALCRSAEVAMTVGNSSEFGISAGEPVIDLPRIMARKDEILAGLRESVGMVLNDVTVIRGEAKFICASTVEVNGECYTAYEIIVATGSRPVMLDIPGKELALSSDEILSIQTLPSSLIIIGGGVIGMEFASIFSAFGVKVTVLEYCKEILPPFDVEIAKRLRTSLKRRGIEIVTSAQVTAINPGLTVEYEVKGKSKTAEAEQVLMAVGRRPVVPEGLDGIGVRFERGAIAVDDNMKMMFDGTAPENVTLYAIGDVNGRCMLAHAAYMHGLVALGKAKLTDVIPAAVFTQPECAMVGLTEEQCAAAGRQIKIGKAMFRSNGKALAMGEPDGLVKIIADSETDELLGCHICGAHAADLVQEVATAMTAGLKASAISTAVHAHPTLTEVVKAAVPK